MKSETAFKLAAPVKTHVEIWGTADGKIFGEVNLKALDGGLRICGVDPGHVMIVETLVKAEAFQEYAPGLNVSVEAEVMLETAKAAMRACGKDSVLGMAECREGLAVYGMGFKRTVSLFPANVEPRVPETPVSVTADLPVKEFADKLGAFFTMYGIDAETYHDGVRFFTQDGLLKAEVKPRSGGEAMIDICPAEGEGQSFFSADYLKQAADSLPGGTVNVQFGASMPLRLVAVSGNIKTTVLLANRAEG